MGLGDFLFKEKEEKFQKRGRKRATFYAWEAGVRRDKVAKGATPGREQIIRRMWKISLQQTESKPNI